MDREEREMYEWWFAGVRPLSQKKKCTLLERFKTAKNIYNIEETELQHLDFLTEKDRAILRQAIKSSDAEQEYVRLKKKKIEVVVYGSPNYPKRLQQIPSPPYALYIKGKLPEDARPSAAIVGARQCTPYGEKMAWEFGEQLASAGVQIISGMARGIDGVAQRAALNAGEASYSVLANGVDICYPKEHLGLYMDLQKNGGVLSEQPIGTAPLREYFPARNRIISGLSDVVLVIEAKERSGSLITADMALEQGKDVYALPGPVNSALSRGCHELLRQGAQVLISPEELLKELELSPNWSSRVAGAKMCKNEKVLETAELLVYSKLDLYPKSIHSLQEETKLTPDKLMQQIISLIMKGYVEEVSRNYYIRADT